MQRKAGRIPVLVLDGVDLLAEDEGLFIRLIRYTKTLANERKLIIVFVSSEGYSVVPLFEDH